MFLESLFYILPTYIANGSMQFTLVIPLLKDWRTPIDFGKSYKGKRILGDGKSFQGLVFGSIWGVITGIIQYVIVQNITFKHLTLFNDFSLTQFMLYGLVLGLGAALGDVFKSLIKRRIGIKRGQPWVPFDQLDFLAGGLIAGSLLYFPGWKTVIILAIITPFIHFGSNITAYLLKWKKVWW